MSNEFNREEHYIVFRMSDLGNSLKGDEIRKLAREYAEHLEQLGKKPLGYVVIAADWSEYGPTWKAIEVRVTGAQPATSFADAYQGAMEEVAIWKKRALEAEELNRKFIAEINGPTYMGEPAQPAPRAPDCVAEALQRLIENGAVLGPASSEDALLVARYRQRLLACAPSAPEGWLRAIDEALVTSHIGVANAEDTYEQAKAKLDNLLGFHVDVATDPAVNGGWKLVPIEPTYEMLEAGEDMLVPTLTDIPVSVPFDVYRAMLAAAPKPEAKP